MSVTSSSAIYPNQQLAVTDMHYVAPPTVAMADDHYLRGVQAVKAHDYLDALFHFSKAVFLAPNEPLPYVARAEAFTHLCDLRSAISNYRKALSLMKDPVAVQDLKARLAQVLDAQGITCFKAGQYSQALRYAEEALGEHYHPTAELHKALYLLATQQNAAAETILTSSLIHKPEVNADATVLLVEININSRKDFATAKMLLEGVLPDCGRQPRVLDAERLFDTAFVKYKQDAEEQEDVDMLSKCLLAFPEDAALYQARAAAHAKRKMYTAAVQDLFASITKAGGTNPAAVAMMTEILSIIASELAQVADYNAAVNYYTEALKWDEDSDHVLLSRGDCHLALGKHEDALRDFKKVLVNAPNHEGAKRRLANLHDVWGGVLYNQSKYELAEAEFSKAINYFDEEPRIFYHRATCRLMMKQPELAVRDLISCRELYPTDPEILNLVHQFCAPALQTIDGVSPRKSRGDDKPSAPPRCPPASVPPPITAVEAPDILEGPSMKHSAAQLSQASASLTTGFSTVEDRFNPLAIREYVRMSKAIASESSVMVITNPLQVPAGQTSSVVPMVNRNTEKITVGNARGAHWVGSTKKLISRLDRFEVSKEAPIPLRYSSRVPKPLPSLESVLGDDPAEDEVHHHVPQVQAPTAPRRSVLSGVNHSAEVSATAPSQFLFSSKASFTKKNTMCVRPPSGSKSK